jgi:hypothetical protein
VASIDDRTIPIKLIEAAEIPPNHSVFFLYSSNLFKVDDDRQKLNLPDTISHEQLNQILRRETGKILAEKIPEIVVKNKNAEKELEEKFPHLVGLFEKSTAGLINKNEALEVAQRNFFRQSKEILQCENLTMWITKNHLRFPRAH